MRTLRAEDIEGSVPQSAPIQVDQAQVHLGGELNGLDGTLVHVDHRSVHLDERVVLLKGSPVQLDGRPVHLDGSFVHLDQCVVHRNRQVDSLKSLLSRVGSPNQATRIEERRIC
jgi:hypothetical protein